MPDDDTESTQRQVDADVVAELAAEGFEDACIAGRGGFGIVYRCRQPALDRVVAVKVLSPDPDHMDRARFLREQQAMGRLSGHPNIVHVLQAGITYTGRPYIVMPFHRRDSLDSWITKHGALRAAEALAVGVKLAGALETAHRAGVLHRDIKPGNILLTEYGEPQLTDFGIARITGGEETTRGLVAGSPAYTAPELLSGSDASVVTDVYGLGATLFTALAGRPAFARRRGEQVFAQLLRIGTEPLPDLRDIGVPEAVCTVIESAMARDPAERPATAADLGGALRRAGEHIGLALGDIPLPIVDEEDRPFRPSDEVEVGVSEYLRYRRGSGTRLDRPPPPSASTKYRPPVTPGVTVARTQLLERLRRSGRPRLVLIHAPAGFGKSTLAAQRLAALRGEGVATAWLTIDNDDNTLIWFLTHLIESIAVAQPAFGRELVRELEVHGADRERYVLTSLIDQLHSSDHHVALVIDDWHRVSNEDTRSALAFLLEHGCHHLHLIVTSRTRLGLPLSRMSVRNELIEIDSSALRFDVRESTQLLIDRSGLHLDAPDIVELEQSTDGWAAALQLVSLALRDHPHPRELIEHLSGGNRAIGEYLAENVLGNLDRSTLDFLLATSITEKICGSLARALTDNREGQATLEDIESRDLFLRRLDEEGRWFRYHHLFAEFLQHRLERDDPDRIVELHRRAGRWFADRHLLSQAVDHYILAGEQDDAVTLVEDAAMELLEQSQMGTLLGLAAKLPAKGTTDRPRLHIALAWAHAILHHPRDAEQNLSAAETALDNAVDDRAAADMRAEATFILAPINVFDDKIDGLDEAVEGCMARADTLRPWVMCGAADVASFRAIYRFDFDEARRWQTWALPFHQRSTGPFSVLYGYCMAGIAAREQLDLPAAEASFRHAMALAEADDGLGYGARLTAALLGDLLYEQGHLADADHLLDRSHTLGAEGGTVDFLLATYGTGARLKRLLGQNDAAKARLDEGARLAQQLRLPRLAARVTNERVRTGIGHAAPGAPVIDRESRQLPARNNGIAVVTFELEEDSAIRAALTARDQDLEPVYERAHALVESIERRVRPRAFLNAALLQVEVSATMGQQDAALTELLPLAEQCARLGLIRPVLDAGPAVNRLARHLRTHLHERADAAASIVLNQYLADLEKQTI
ncbi:probable serine-threonine protein kinase/ transcriptional regulator (plasmid) [Rhodococcus jostii RHA1]|uniref:Serine/threonine-protein kinase PknK n=1 Tax=Rhodococcus jostii (strain RHA1) TaxID=101510 RepID=Q0RXP9_RHOJR|nr:serine/threonine-protein kinase [Rhodococcus jostii]ABG99937.1 probable serine-threonine protein kinase/ transcriptional regulator [Rhodococcus jostii RHA1]